MLDTGLTLRAFARTHHHPGKSADSVAHSNSGQHMARLRGQPDAAGKAAGGA
ncbi:MAG: hypothetical protein AAGA28_05840 [Pseudomonadota bacterium]